MEQNDTEPYGTRFRPRPVTLTRRRAAKRSFSRTNEEEEKEKEEETEPVFERPVRRKWCGYTFTDLHYPCFVLPPSLLSLSPSLPPSDRLTATRGRTASPQIVPLHTSPLYTSSHRDPQNDTRRLLLPILFLLLLVHPPSLTPASFSPLPRLLY